MSLPRRHFLRLAGAMAALPAIPRIARAETYPVRPLRLIVGYPPGGSADSVARLIGQALAERLGQPVIVENKAGSANNIAAETVAHSAPDGYTLLLVVTASAINATLYERLSFDLLRDVVPVAGLVRLPLVMEVSPSLPARTVDEFIALATLKTSRINMASSGIGTAPHLAGELFKAKTGIDMTHVPYRGEPPALADIMSGQVQVMFGSIAASIETIRAGKLRALAVTTARRLDALPEVPTVSEFVPDYEASAWYGIGVAKSTPRDIVDRLNVEINAVLDNARVTARLRDLGTTPMPFTSAEFAAHVTAETAKWGKLVRSLGLKAPGGDR
jgi:tripartite-type tricarboxylate transporter receptor subunit TctC